MNPILSFLTFLIYPLWFPIHVFRSQASDLMKLLSIGFAAVVLLPIWIGSYVFIGITINYGTQYFGVTRTEIPVVGASMLPTIEGDTQLPVHHYPHFEDLKEIGPLRPYVGVLQPELDRGDIVVFKNAETVKVFDEQQKDPRKQGGFVKRVIGVPGDVVTIRNGFVRVNGTVIEEPYILKARSTFGGEVVRDCSVIEVPDDHYFLLGDNRKISLDSRHVGLVRKDAVKYYIPFEEQVSQMSRNWRDASRDQDTAFQSELDAAEYVDLLNQKRAERGLEPLALEPKLAESARKRAQVMLEYDDLSFEATRSGYTIDDAFADVGYSNIVYGEFPVLGYYNAQELIDSFFEYPSSRDFLLSDTYDEIGISTFVGTLHGCPVQIVVQHLAGYVPPNYAAAQIQDWRDLLTSLNDIREGWLELKLNGGEFYEENKADVDRINDIIRTRAQRVRQIISRMEANEWFTDDEERFIEEDAQLLEEQGQIADRLNQKLSELQ